LSEAISRRNLFSREFRPLRKAVAAAIAKADPIRLLHLGAPGDEYDQEVSAILPELRSASSEEDVCRIIRAEFARRFGDDIAGPPERYTEASASIWRALQSACPPKLTAGE
jgi:hypothetical protein